MNAMHPDEADPAAADFSAMEAALRDACTRARHAIFSLAAMLKLYRSVASLARALMRARLDEGLSHGLGDEMIALLNAARDAACAHFPDPEMPVMDALAIHRAVASLAAVAHRARAGRRGPLVGVGSDTPSPLADRGWEEGSDSAGGAVTTPLPGPPPQGETEDNLTSPSFDAIDPDGPHCAWRRDHTAERDQRAYELLRTVIEERVYTKIKALNQRERAAREAEQQPTSPERHPVDANAAIPY